VRTTCKPMCPALRPAFCVGTGLGRCSGGGSACCLPVFLVRFGAGGSAGCGPASPAPDAAASACAAPASGFPPCPRGRLPRMGALPRPVPRGAASPGAELSGAAPKPARPPAAVPASPLLWRPPTALPPRLPTPAGGGKLGAAGASDPAGEPSPPGFGRFGGVQKGKAGGVSVELVGAGLGMPDEPVPPDEPADGSELPNPTGLAEARRPADPWGETPGGRALGDALAGCREAPFAGAPPWGALPRGDPVFAFGDPFPLDLAADFLPGAPCVSWCGRGGELLARVRGATLQHMRGQQNSPRLTCLRLHTGSTLRHVTHRHRKSNLPCIRRTSARPARPPGHRTIDGPTFSLVATAAGMRTQRCRGWEWQTGGWGMADGGLDGAPAVLDAACDSRGSQGPYDVGVAPRCWRWAVHGDLETQHLVHGQPVALACPPVSRPQQPDAQPNTASPPGCERMRRAHPSWGGVWGATPGPEPIGAGGRPRRRKGVPRGGVKPPSHWPSAPGLGIWVRGWAGRCAGRF
jgi:hypothetical protein